MKAKWLKKFMCVSMCMTMACAALAGCSSDSEADVQEAGSDAEETEQADGEEETAADDAESANAENAAAEGKVLTMAVGAELNTLYPLNMDVQNNVATKLCYEGLVNYVDGEIVPCLAESWEFSEDGKDLTF